MNTDKNLIIAKYSTTNQNLCADSKTYIKSIRYLSRFQIINRTVYFELSISNSGNSIKNKDEFHLSLD